MSTKAPLCPVSLVRLIFPTKWKAIVFKLFFRLCQRVSADPQRERESSAFDPAQHTLSHVQIKTQCYDVKLKNFVLSNSKTQLEESAAVQARLKE